MIKRLNFEGPINSLSLGNVTVNFLRELISKGIKLNTFVVSDRAEFAAYDRIDEGVRETIIKSASERFVDYDASIPVLKVWHINGSHFRAAKNQYLYTFYEVDDPTPQEVGIVKSQEHVFFSSSAAANIFKERGCENVSFVPLGFDKDFNMVPENKVNGVIHFSLIGKFESRKNTRAIIKAWTELFGDKQGYQLSLLVNNPFIPEEEFASTLMEALGKRWANVNLLPRLDNNSQVASLHKSTDIDLSGLSSGEGWNLPSFNSTCLGKWSVVSNCSSHKDWANDENSILIEPEGKRPCYDGRFFQEGAPFNQGELHVLPSDTIKSGILKAVERFRENPVNKQGKKLQEVFTYSNTLDKILDKIKKDNE